MLKTKLKQCLECKQNKIIYSKKLCLDCYKKKYPEKFILKKRNSKISKTSTKQQERLNKYYLLKKQYLKDNKFCEVCKTNLSIEIHHMKRRHGDQLYNNFLAVCRVCHSKIENNKEWAVENGYSIEIHKNK